MGAISAQSWGRCYKVQLAAAKVPKCFQPVRGNGQPGLLQPHRLPADFLQLPAHQHGADGCLPHRGHTLLKKLSVEPSYSISSKVSSSSRCPSRFNPTANHAQPRATVSPPRCLQNASNASRSLSGIRTKRYSSSSSKSYSAQPKADSSWPRAAAPFSWGSCIYCTPTVSNRPSSSAGTCVPHFFRSCARVSCMAPSYFRISSALATCCLNSYSSIADSLHSLNWPSIIPLRYRPGSAMNSSRLVRR